MRNFIDLKQGNLFYMNMSVLVVYQVDTCKNGDIIIHYNDLSAESKVSPTGIIRIPSAKALRHKLSYGYSFITTSLKAWEAHSHAEINHLKKLAIKYCEEQKKE